ncbi:hypothetical protein BH09VER1_BH09VER1_35970 [soil metagenome]
MIGAYDFCGHYEWTFSWMEETGGEGLLREYWETAISVDANSHARKIIVVGGLEGMRRYWQHTLEEEAAGYQFTSDETRFRIDMHECPSKGFLLKNGLVQYRDYCDHCIGWIGPMIGDAGFVIDHEHNHCGQCWWEIRRLEDPSAPSGAGEFSGAKDVRLRDDWVQPETDRFRRATDVGRKEAPSSENSKAKI